MGVWTAANRLKKILPFFPFLVPLTRKPYEKGKNETHTHTHAHTQHKHTHTKTCRWMQGQDGKRV